MSQVTQPAISVHDQIRAHWVVALSALLALLAAAAVSLALAIDSGPSTSASIAEQQPAVRPDGGPDESAVAASIGSRPSARPDESTVAAAIAGTTNPGSGRPDESTVAAAISGR